MVENSKEVEVDTYCPDSIVRSVILNYLFRFDSLLDNSNQLFEINPFLISKISRETIASESESLRLLEHVLEEIDLFWDKLGSISRSKAHKRDELYDVAHKYLTQAYDIAPIFDISRAEINLKILHNLFSKEFFWPKISIQLSLVIFVTDRNDPHWKKIGFILQKNLRSFLSCSAYAFHRSRNKLGITKEGQLET